MSLRKDEAPKGGGIVVRGLSVVKYATVCARELQAMRNSVLGPTGQRRAVGDLSYLTKSC